MQPNWISYRHNAPILIDIFIRMSLIGAEYSKPCVYMTHFYADQAFIPISFVHVTTATDSNINFFHLKKHLLKNLLHSK